MSITKLSNVESLQSLFFYLLKDANIKMKSLKVEKSKLIEKFIGLQFNMEDYKIATLEAQETFNVVAFKIEHLRGRYKDLQS